MNRRFVWALLVALGTASLAAQAPQQQSAATPPPVQLAPSFDLSAMDSHVDPCQDFYQFACGNYAGSHPIPADQSASSAFTNLFNVNTQELRGILEQAAAAGAARTPNEQKIGDFYSACMDTAAIDRKGLEPLSPLLKEIDGMGLLQLATVTGHLQRINVNVLLSFGEQQDLKDARKQIAFIGQGGLGLPEKDYYFRTGAKDEQVRKDYIEHVAKMLALSGTPAPEARRQAEAIFTFESGLAKNSLGVVDLRDPEKTYHLVSSEVVAHEFPFSLFTQFVNAVHAPHLAEINDSTPGYIPALIRLVRSTDIQTVRAYMRYHLLTAMASQLPSAFNEEDFDFYRRKLTGAAQQRPRWKQCSTEVDTTLGEALGEVYVRQYFAGDSKQKMLEMVSDIEHAMDRDLDRLDWMTPPTRQRAKEKLHAIANKIGYPEHWRDYSALTISPGDALGNLIRADQFENDRVLARIGKPVDPSEWEMTPPTVNAYYDPSMNNINFPAGILQPNFYDPKADLAVNYGHIGAVIGHELTHGFDDQGRKFDAKGNLSDWWTPEDAKKFEAKTDCLVNEYSQFVPVDDVHVNGKLTLGENTADNGGLVLAYMAYLDRAKSQNVDPSVKIDGFTGPQRFYIAWAQNWCSNDKPESLRSRALTDPHSPGRFRATGSVVNQPGFAGAFSCKAGSPMVPVNSCRVW